MSFPLQSAPLPSPDPGLPAGVAWLLAVAGLGFWIASHRISRRWLNDSWQRIPGWFLRVAAGTLALWSMWEAVRHILVLETGWPLVVHGVLGATVIESVLTLLRGENRAVSRQGGRWIAGLRIVSLLAILTILIQPVFKQRQVRTIDRNVVVLLDDSGSMQQNDPAMPVGERLALAGWLGLKGLGERPDLQPALEAGENQAAALEAAIESVRPADGLNPAESKALVERDRGKLVALLDSAEQWSNRVAAAIDREQELIRKMPQKERDDARELARLPRQLISEDLARARLAVNQGEGRDLRVALRNAAISAHRIVTRGAWLGQQVDDTFYSGINPEIRAEVDAATSRSRRELAIEAIRRPGVSGASFLDQLKQKYTVRYVSFAREAVESPELPPAPVQEGSMTGRTDFAAALEKVQQTWPAESLAGAILLTDGRHTGTVPPDDAARRLGMQGSPVCPVLLGSEAGARDAAIASVQHPTSLFLGDRIRVSVDLKVDRLRGQVLQVQLERDGKVVKEEKLTVPGDRWRTTIRLDEIPPEKGIFTWKVRIQPVGDEQFLQNNEWTFEAAVSDDRTNVLLIEDRPRWEFRYLRNLFDSRDKSVQLQYVLLHPDTLEGAAPLPDIPASAGRPFGESEATRLPVSPEEWRKFDVIILGDVSPGSLSPDLWQTLRQCVGDRGAMLVMIAGPNFLPHAFGHPAARELIPLKYQPSTERFGAAPEPAYKLALTAEGRQSPIFSQSASGVENTRIWEQMPVLRWRFPHQGVKEGAQVLAYAHPVPGDSGTGELSGLPLPELTGGDPATALARRRQMEQDYALITAAQVDLGKVVMLAFDQTWRFRYGIGDTYHHRFWGQLLRWGAGDQLPTGTANVRLGTDALSYEPGQPIVVKARLRDPLSRPVQDAEVQVKLMRGDQQVLTQRMEFRKDSQGLYEARLEGIQEAATYRVELSGFGVQALAGSGSTAPVSQNITVGPDRNSPELGDLSIDRDMASRIASLSGGIPADPGDLEKLLAVFGPGTQTREEVEETSLWDNWIILLIATGALTAEWILRRRYGLA